MAGALVVGFLSAGVPRKKAPPMTFQSKLKFYFDFAPRGKNHAESTQALFHQLTERSNFERRNFVLVKLFNRSDNASLSKIYDHSCGRS
jgi:hypothetical protein